MKLAETKRLKAKLAQSVPAKNYPPLSQGQVPPYDPAKGSEATIFHQQGTPVVVRLPRSGQGKAPRKGVHIPMPSFSPPRFARAGKHARQHHTEGKFGSKKARATLAVKLAMLYLGWLYTIQTMLARWERRQALREVVA